MSKQAKFLASLQQGNELTAAQVTSRFGIKNVTATVSAMRSQGFCVYANSSKTGTTKYRLGTPTRIVIAAGIRALRSGE